MPWWQQKLNADGLALEFRNRTRVPAGEEDYDPDAWLTDEEFYDKYLGFGVDVDAESDRGREALKALGVRFEQH